MMQLAMTDVAMSGSTPLTIAGTDAVWRESGQRVANGIIIFMSDYIDYDRSV